MVISGDTRFSESLIGQAADADVQRSRQAQEIGIRMALGAERRTVLAMVVSEALLLAGTGVAVGLGIALASTR